MLLKLDTITSHKDTLCGVKSEKYKNLIIEDYPGIIYWVKKI